MNAIAQPTALEIKDMKDAMGRLELAAGVSDGGTIVSTSSGNAIRSIMNHSSTPSSESPWANDFIMSVIDIQTRTRNDSIDLLDGNGADETVFPRWFAPHVETHQCELIFLAKNFNHFVTRALGKRKRYTFVSRSVMNMIRSCLLVVSLRCTMTALHDSRTMMHSYGLKADTT